MPAHGVNTRAAFCVDEKWEISISGRLRRTGAVNNNLSLLKGTSTRHFRSSYEKPFFSLWMWKIPARDWKLIQWTNIISLMSNHKRPFAFEWFRKRPSCSIKPCCCDISSGIWHKIPLLCIDSLKKLWNALNFHKFKRGRKMFYGNTFFIVEHPHGNPEALKFILIYIWKHFSVTECKHLLTWKSPFSGRSWTCQTAP